MAGVLKLCRKSAISLFLLVIMGSLTLKNVDKRDGYILSDVSELFVAKSLSMETTLGAVLVYRYTREFLLFS